MAFLYMSFSGQITNYPLEDVRASSVGCCGREGHLRGKWVEGTPPKTVAHSEFQTVMNAVPCSQTK